MRNRVPNPNGRPKGSKNKNTKEFIELYESIIAEEPDLCPVRVLFDLIARGTDQIKLKAAGDLLQYRYQKRKAIDVSGDVDTAIQISWLNEANEKQTQGS